MSDDLLGPGPERQAVDDASQVRLAVQLAARHARAAGFTSAAVDTVTLVATELAENLHRHAVGGELLVLPPVGDDGDLVLVALDRGPGVDGFDRCRRDGYTTIGTLGVGLGTVGRLARHVDAASEPGRGTVVAATFSRSGASPAGRDDRSWFDVGAVGFPIASETRNGDAWTTVRRGSRLVVAVADGLGHGPDAALASWAVVDALPGAADGTPAAVVAAVAEAASRTRGAAVTVAALEVDALRGGGEVASAGLGNVALAVVAADGSTRRTVTTHGTAGRGAPRSHDVSTPFPVGGALVLHTDGLQSRWDLAGRAELLRHDAVVVAAALWRDHSRDTDDTCVVVVRAGARR